MTDKPKKIRILRAVSSTFIDDFHCMLKKWFRRNRMQVMSVFYNFIFHIRAVEKEDVRSLKTDFKLRVIFKNKTF